MKYQGFSIVVQYHDQPPIETKAYRPIRSREFLPGITLAEAYEWAEKNQRECGQIESVIITPLSA